MVVWRNVYRYFVETSASDEKWLSDFASDEKKFSTSSEDRWSLRRINLPSHLLRQFGPNDGYITSSVYQCTHPSSSVLDPQTRVWLLVG